jgi:hypothetical protein
MSQTAITSQNLSPITGGRTPGLIHHCQWRLAPQVTVMRRNLGCLTNRQRLRLTAPLCISSSIILVMRGWAPMKSTCRLQTAFPQTLRAHISAGKYVIDR